MIRRILVQSVLLGAVAACMALFWAPTEWHIDIGTRGAQRYTTSLRDIESAPIGNVDQTFQWATPGARILLAQPTSMRILTLHTMQRSEQPPRSVTLQLAPHVYTIPGDAGMRIIRLLAPASHELSITCDTSDSSDATLRGLCLAFLSLDSRRIGVPVDLRSLGIIVLFACTVAVATTLSLRDHPRTSLVAGLALIGVAFSFPHALSISLPGLLAFMVGWAGALVFIHWRTTTPWLRVALIAVCANIILKATGIVSPGYYGTDIGFHANKYTAVLSSDFYQIADGQGLTYPYPPTVYYLLALVALPLQSLCSLLRIIHLSAVVIDSTTIILLAWLAHSYAWSLRRIALLSALYVVLPAGYLLQWQATVAQTIGQWFAVIAIVTSLTGRGALSRIAMAATMVGHFGAFLTLHLTYTLAFLRRTLRPLAWRWWGVLGIVTVVYLSQYAGTIAAQIGSLRNTDGATTLSLRWWQFAWQYGLFGHYNGVFVALMLIGMLRMRADRLRSFGWLMVVSSTLLLVAQVLADIDTTRYVIALFPLVALAASIPLAQMWRSSAGKVLVVSLVALTLVHSSTAWYAGVIDGVRMGFLW
jgi:hypothetical protein